MSINPLLKGLPPTHPGEVLRDIVVPGSGLSVTAFAEALGIGRRTLYDIFDGKTGVTAETALRLGKLLGGRAELWMNLQASYDLKVAAEALAPALAGIKPIPYPAPGA